MTKSDKDFEQWATMQGLLYTDWGVSREHANIDIARSAWKARTEQLETVIAELNQRIEDLGYELQDANSRNGD